MANANQSRIVKVDDTELSVLVWFTKVENGRLVFVDPDYTSTKGDGITAKLSTHYSATATVAIAQVNATDVTGHYWISFTGLSPAFAEDDQPVLRLDGEIDGVAWSQALIPIEVQTASGGGGSGGCLMLTGSNDRDYALESTFDVKFTTRSFSTGIPATLGGTPAVEIYEDNSAVQITSGITLTADFDSVTGLNNLRIAATAANGFEAGKSYSAVISTGTVGGVSVVGEVICNFSIQRVSAAVEADLDDRLPVAAAKTNLDTVFNTDFAANYDATNDRWLVDSVAISGDSVAADNLEAALDGTGGVTITANITGNITGNLSGSVGSVTGAVGSVTGSVGSVTGSVGSISGITFPSNFGSLLINVSGHISRVTLVDTTTANTDMRGTDSALLAASAPTNFGDLSITATTGRVTVGTNTDKTGYDLSADQSGVTIGVVNAMAGTITTLDALDTAQDVSHAATQSSISALNDISVADILTTQMTEAYAAAGVAPTLAQALFWVMQHLDNSAISGTTKTVKKLDGATTAGTLTLDDATTPTSIARAT